MSEHCDRCGCEVKYEFIDHRTVKSIYRVFGADKMCEPCGDKTDSFISYYGKKKLGDIRKMREYIQSGAALKPFTKKLYSQLINAGYS